MTRGKNKGDSPPRATEAGEDVEDRLSLLESGMAQLQSTLEMFIQTQLETKQGSMEPAPVEPSTPSLDGGMGSENPTSVEFTNLGVLPVADGDTLGACPPQVQSVLKKLHMGPMETHLAIGFRASPPGGFPWDVAHQSGVLDKGQIGYRRYLPSGSVLRLLVPWWTSHQSATMDFRTAQQFLPVLVSAIPGTETMSKSSRGPGTWCVTLESFTKVFIEALAIIGPGARGALEVGLQHVAQWHTDSTLVGVAMAGLGFHPLLHKVLQQGSRPRTLHDLFELASQVLGTDEESATVEASKALSQLTLKNGTPQDLMAVRRQFAEIASILQGHVTTMELRRSFFDVCVRSARTPEALHRFFTSPAAAATTRWEDLWLLLYTRVRDARDTLDLSREGSSKALALNHLQAGGEWTSETREESYDPAMEEEEFLDLNNLTVTDLSDRLKGQRVGGLSAPDVAAKLREMCSGCWQTGHFQRDCPHKEASTFTADTATGRAVFLLALERLREMAGGGYPRRPGPSRGQHRRPPI